MKSAKKIIAALLCFLFAGLALCLAACGGAEALLTINEVVSSNSASLIDPEYGSPDWVELYNPSSVSVDISGYFLSDDVTEITKYTFPEGTVIMGGGCIVVYCSRDAAASEGRHAAPFNISAGGETLFLADSDRRVISKVEVPQLAQDISYCRKSDGNFGFCASPSPNAPNNDSRITESLELAKEMMRYSDSLALSELYKGEDGQWAEVRNPSGETVKLSDFFLSDDPAVPDKWKFPEAALEAGGYAVVNLMGGTYIGAESAENTEYPEFFANFKLNSSSEDCLYLFDAGAGLLDTLEYDLNMPGPVSAVKSGDAVMYTAFPTEGAANSDKTFASASWTDADSSDPVRINEVLPRNEYSIIDGDGDRCEWVELYNSSSSAVGLLGYYLSDSAEKPDKWALPDITLGAGEYLLIFLSGKDSTEGELHASFGLSKSDTAVYLSNYDGMRQDTLPIPPELSANVSVGRGENAELLYYAQPTPGGANTTHGFIDYIGVGGFSPESVYISEVCAVQAAGSGGRDWIELYNGSGEGLTLSGWHISDDVDELYKYELSGITIPSGGYAYFYCSSKSGEQNSSTAPFGLSGSGETLFLTDAGGYIADVFTPGVQDVGITSGRMRDAESGERVFFAEATRGEKNPQTYYSSYAPSPVFSDTRLYCSEPFALSIGCANAAAEIRYTLDGSEPSAASALYTGPLNISGNAVVRAASFIGGRLMSRITTRTYLFEREHSLPVVAIAMDGSAFNEMYSAVAKTPKVERECFMQFFAEDGKLGVETGAGLRVGGSSTRVYPQKTLNVYFRSAYGRSSVTYPFFGDYSVNTFKSMVLRNSGQDAYNARIRDAFASMAVLDLDVDAAASSFVVVYINGEYWGIYDLKENQNEDYLAAHYGVDPDTVEIIKRNTVVLAGSSADDFLRVRAYGVDYPGGIKEYYYQSGVVAATPVPEGQTPSPSEEPSSGAPSVIPLTPERYAQYTEWVDSESIADYLIARSYFYDGDMFNQKYWRTTDYAVRWRAVFYDSDFMMGSGSPNGSVLSSYFRVTGVPSANGTLSNMDLYCALNSSPEWREAFIIRYIYVVKYYFNNDRLLPLYDSMAEQLAAEMERHIARWGKPASVSQWERNIAVLRDGISGRADIALSQLKRQYNLSESEYAAYEAQADALYAQNGSRFVP